MPSAALSVELGGDGLGSGCGLGCVCCWPAGRVRSEVWIS